MSYMSEPGLLPWRHGDIVLDLYGRVWTRASAEDEAHGLPWARGVGTGPNNGLPGNVEGDSADDAPARPLALVARNGKPVSDPTG